MPPKSKSDTGAAGEFYVAAQLAQRGWAASLLLGNAPRTDILAQHPSGVQVGVQSKAANGSSFSIGASSDVPSPAGAREWFVLVSLAEPDTRPDFYVVPRNVIAAFSWSGHQNWLTTFAKNGSAHRDSSIRNIKKRDLEPYRERWDDLLRPPDEVPYWFIGGFWEWEAKVGLPPGHPGVVRPSDDFLRTGVAS